MTGKNKRAVVVIQSAAKNLLFLRLLLLVFCSLFPIPCSVARAGADADYVRLPQDFVIPLNESGWEALWVLDQKQDLASCKPTPAPRGAGVPKQPQEFDCGSARYRIKLRLSAPGPDVDQSPENHRPAPEKTAITSRLSRRAVEGRKH